MMFRKLNLFRILCLVTALLFLFLFIQLIFLPKVFVSDLGLESSLTSSILARRAAMFMLGLSSLLFLANNITTSRPRQYISLSTGITLIGLTCMSSYELIKGNVNSSMLQAAIIEASLGLLFWFDFIRNSIKKHK